MTRARRLARLLALAGVGGAVTIAALAPASSPIGSDTSAGAAPVTTATADVARRDLVQRSTVPGTLGYGDSRTIVNYRQGTITLLPEEGGVLQPGAVLYAVNEQPVVLLSGSQPAWRPLTLGVSEGRDVRQLEQNLRALGYDPARELAIDRQFSSSTAAAVQRWQEDRGLEATGRVELGAVVFLRGARRIGAVTVSLGDLAGPGTPVLASTSTNRLISAEIDAADQQDVVVGDKVMIDLRNGTTTTGTITGVGTVASRSGDETGAGQPASGSTTSTIALEVRPDKPAAAGSLDQAPVDVGVTSERAKNALSVPVSALLALRGGRYGVEVVRAGTTTVVEVTPGLYSDGGYVEIKRGGVRAGDVVVVPT